MSLIFGALNVSMIFYMDYVQTITRSNVDLQLASTISQTDEYTRNAWDYIHNTVIIFLFFFFLRKAFELTNVYTINL